MVAPAAVATAGSAVYDAAKKYGPEAIKKAQDYLNRSGAGASIAALAKGNTSEQAAVITALKKGGLGANVITDAMRELTPAESVKWAGLVQNLVREDANASDKGAIDHSQSGDAGLDSIVRSRMIHQICGFLNVSSDQLGMLLTFFRTARHEEIERYQRDFQILGLRAR